MRVRAIGHLERVLARLSRLSPLVRVSMTMTHDAAAMLTAMWLAFSLRLSDPYWPIRPQVLALWGVTIAGGLAALYALNTYNMVVRYTDNRAAGRLLVGSASAAVVWFVAAFLSGVDVIPRSVGFIYSGFLFLILYFNRLAVAFLLRTFGVRPSGSTSDLPSVTGGVAIVGTNAASQGLVEALATQAKLEMRFFVNDDPAFGGRRIAGFPVQSMTHLEQAAKTGEVRHVFLGLTDAGRSERIALVAKMSAMGLNVMALPTYAEFVTGRFRISDVHPIKVDDLLSRDQVPLVPHLIESEITGKTVLITGAGGSIGSEIARKVLGYGPDKLVLFDHAEYALYSIDAELRATNAADLPIHPVIGSLLTDGLIDRVLAEHAVDLVLHAAAYKHVPLLEQNEITGIRNNVLGTKILADACVAAGVERFTMVSTDKAVRPISLMGASKRIAELYVQALAARPDNKVRFGIVRFGNVLDSSGSVVQQFRRQIVDGGPVTVTHEDIVRFFMSIPEATELVLQANSMALNGEVFVLEMGDPVRIADLARTMIALSGLSERNAAHPDGDIEISFVGLRPGEKLYEELFVTADIKETLHPQIKMAQERWLPMAQLEPMLDRLVACLDDYDLDRLRPLVSEFLAVDDLEKRAIATSSPLRAMARR